MTVETNQRRVHLIIRGKVQGVGFRHSASMIANHIGVLGWVKNLADGSVESVAEGSQAAVENYLRWCHLGPQFSQVSEVQVTEEEPTGEFDDFQSRR